jgi:excisionase family DNA binding protein
MQLLYPVNDAAKTLGVGRTTLFKLIASGDIETVTIGSRRLVPVGALENFIERLRNQEGGVSQ